MGHPSERSRRRRRHKHCGDATTAGKVKAPAMHSAIVEGCHDRPTCEEKRGEAGEPDQISFGRSREPQPHDEVPDCYEIFQLSSKADLETIHRVYRILAQRYHPKNTDTGHGGLFHALNKAYSILSNPERRAVYDASYQANRRFRAQIFNLRHALSGRADDKLTRLRILDVLYASRSHQPQGLGLTVDQLKNLLGCPQGQLKFNLRYLREEGMITSSNNGSYSITVKGVDVAESESTQQELSSLGGDGEFVYDHATRTPI